MAQLMMVNPRKRRKTRRRKARRNPVARRTRRATRRSTPARRVRRYKRNPNGRGIINQQLVPAATNAAGALALDVIWGFLPIPEGVKTGMFRHVAKGAGAIALGMVARNVVQASTAKAMSQGALTVVLHGAMREMAQQMMPNVPLGYYSAGMPVSEYTGYNNLNGLDAYIGGGQTSPYLSRDTLAKPFEGPSAADVASAAATECLEKENNFMSGYYSY